MAGSGQWRYIAQRYTGELGALGDFLDFNVPLQDANIEDVLSGHNALNGTITPEFMRLKGADGKPIITEMGTAIWAEDPDGEIRGGGLLTHSSFAGPVWNLECTGLTGTSIDLPYTEANFWIGVDPIDLFRYIWGWIQSQPGGNVGIDVDVAHSPVRLGDTMIQRVDFDLEQGATETIVLTPVPTQPNPYANNAAWIDQGVKVMKAVGWTASVVRDALNAWLAKTNDNPNVPPLTAQQRNIKDKVIQKIGWPPNPPPPRTGGPETTYVEQVVTTPGTPAPVVWEYDAYKLAWYKDHNLASVIDDLAAMTPFDWYLESRWTDDGMDEPTIRHNIRVGYPRLGRRRDDLRFVIGENVQQLPSIERDGTAYANEVMLLGAGEGSAQVVARSFRRADGKVRKVAVVSDPGINDLRLAQIRADQELAKRIILDDMTEIVLNDHPHAPAGSVDLGDEILLEGETGWIDLEVWCRVVARRISPDASDAVTLTVIRSDRLA
jgi:hypothetical protein